MSEQASAAERANPSADNIPDGDRGLLLVHLAEYNALTTRVTYWLTLQFAVWPIMMGLGALLALLWGKLPNTVVLWGGALLAQMFGVMWYAVTIELYRAVRYIEQDLRPLVEAAIGNRSRFWNYERRNHEDRGEFLPFIWEWPVALGGLIIVGWISIRRPLPWGMGDYIAFASNALLSLGMVVAAINARKIRRQID